jgi:hypothetical protein
MAGLVPIGIRIAERLRKILPLPLREGEDLSARRRLILMRMGLVPAIYRGTGGAR